MTEYRKNTITLLPGQTRGTSSDGISACDCGIELGLTQTTSLYVGELATATLIAAGIAEAVAKAHKGWWVALIEGGKLTPVAFTAPYADGDEPNILINAVGAAIRQARASAFLDGLPVQGRENMIGAGE